MSCTQHSNITWKVVVENPNNVFTLKLKEHKRKLMNIVYMQMSLKLITETELRMTDSDQMQSSIKRCVNNSVDTLIFPVLKQYKAKTVPISVIAIVTNLTNGSLLALHMLPFLLYCYEFPLYLCSELETSPKPIYSLFSSPCLVPICCHIADI